LLAWGIGLAIEEPSYTVLRAYPQFEVRRYEPCVVAQTLVEAAPDAAANQGFRLLAGYIFGQNHGSRSIEMTAPVGQAPARIAMTAPVAQSAATSGYLITFTMPRAWTLQSLPQPNDPRVTLRAVPQRTVAVLRYSGGWSQARYLEQLQQLETALAQAGLRWHGAPVWARYDPPWKLWFLRRNEIWLELDAAPALAG
jgi:hypothetical protein